MAEKKGIKGNAAAARLNFGKADPLLQTMAVVEVLQMIQEEEGGGQGEEGGEEGEEERQFAIDEEVEVIYVEK
jgi:hypothetical protein